MIILPTRRKLIRKRDALYQQLEEVVHCATIHQIEDIMRKIHGINLKLKTYFRRNEYEPKEVFKDDDNT